MEKLLNYLSQQKPAIFCKKTETAHLFIVTKQKTAGHGFLQNFSKFSVGEKMRASNFRPAGHLEIQRYTERWAGSGSRGHHKTNPAASVMESRPPLHNYCWPWLSGRHVVAGVLNSAEKSCGSGEEEPRPSKFQRSQRPCPLYLPERCLKTLTFSSPLSLTSWQGGQLPASKFPIRILPSAFRII